MKHNWMKHWKSQIPAFRSGISSLPRSIALATAGVCLATVMLATGAPAANEANKNDSGFIRSAEKWQSKMSDIFRDTWQSLRGGAPAAATASVDLREQDQAYVVRLNLPKRDLAQVEVTLDGGVLRIMAPGVGNVSRYEQALTLPGAGTAAEMKIERKPADNLIVVTVPKQSVAAELSKPANPGIFLPAPLADWDRDLLRRMDLMNREMDRVFKEAFDEFRDVPAHQGYFDLPSFGSSVAIKEEGPNYIVSAYLPARDMSHVDVSVEGSVLRIEAKAEDAGSAPGPAEQPARRRYSHYLQTLTLPGPVQVDKMKVERKEGMLTITLPKS